MVISSRVLPPRVSPVTARTLSASPPAVAGNTVVAGTAVAAGTAVVAALARTAVMGTGSEGSLACPEAFQCTLQMVRQRPQQRWQPWHRRYRHGFPNQPINAALERHNETETGERTS